MERYGDAVEECNSKNFWIILLLLRLSIWNYAAAAVYFCAAAFCDWRIGASAGRARKNG